MDAIYGLFNLSSWGLILRAAAIVHFIRRRPDFFWIWVILFIPFGSFIYIAMEIVPDLGLLRHSFEGFPRRKRIRHLEALVTVNPAAGNLEELGDLYMDERNFQRAREIFDRAIASRVKSDDAYYRRGIAEIETGDFAAAVEDLEYVTGQDSKYDLHRAMGLLAHAYARTGQPDKAQSCFEAATRASTSSETYLNYAQFLASQSRSAEAREWAQKVLQKKPTMPAYLRRRERPWFRQASSLLKKLPAS
jgi:hypothetical protein